MKRYALVLLAASAYSQTFVRIPADPPFWMGRTEVTVKQFATFVKATGYVTKAEQAKSARTWLRPGYRVSASQPVVYVTLEDASACCAWMGGRLPTAAEWELAARAGARTRHYWGDGIDGRYLWYRPNSGGHPHPVARKLPNAWGLFDVEGNVWEWTLDPPGAGGRHGASWISCEDIETEPGRPPGRLIDLSVAFKIAPSYGHRYDDIGFRCLRSRP